MHFTTIYREGSWYAKIKLVIASLTRETWDGTVNVTLKNGETVAATGWKAWLGNLGVKLGSGAATAGGAAAVGGASLLGGALGIAGIGSAAGNIYNAVTSKDSATKKSLWRCWGSSGSVDWSWCRWTGGNL